MNTYRPKYPEIKATPEGGLMIIITPDGGKAPMGHYAFNLLFEKVSTEQEHLALYSLASEDIG